MITLRFRDNAWRSALVPRIPTWGSPIWEISSFFLALFSGYEMALYIYIIYRSIIVGIYMYLSVLIYNCFHPQIDCLIQNLSYRLPYRGRPLGVASCMIFSWGVRASAVTAVTFGQHIKTSSARMGRPWKKNLQPLENKFKGFTPANPWKKNLIPWKRNLSTQPEPGWRGVGGGGRSASPPHAFAKHAT